MKIKIIVPSKLSEITLEKYQKFAKLNTEQNEDSSFMMHKTVEIFCGLELKDIAKIKYKYVKDILSDLDKLFSVKHNLIPTFKLNGLEYGFIPVLDDMSLGEYIDLDENFSDWDKMHKAMSVLYRPITLKKDDRYQIEEYKGVNENLKKMPLDVVMGSMVFFWNLNSELMTTTLNYLKREANNSLTIQQVRDLERSGVSISQSMESLKEMLPSLTPLQN